MAVLAREDFVARVAGYVGDRNGDDDISFLEDVNDTYADMEARASTDWEAKYRENDEQWRKRYRDRFNGVTENTPEPPDQPQGSVPEDEPITSYEQLFDNERR